MCIFKGINVFKNIYEFLKNSSMYMYYCPFKPNYVNNNNSFQIHLEREILNLVFGLIVPLFYSSGILNIQCIRILLHAYHLFNCEILKIC